MTFEKKLREKTQNTLNFINKQAWDNKKFFANWSAQTFHFVKHSTRLLALCAVKTAPSEIKEFGRYMEHIDEEKNHEFLAKRDIENLGFSLDDFKEYSSTKSMYKTQYFNIDNYGHKSFMGYVLALEMLAEMGGIELSQKIKNLHGCESSFLRVHGEEDEDHLISAFNTLKTWSDEEIEIVSSVFDETMETYKLIISQINEDTLKETNLPVAA